MRRTNPVRPALLAALACFAAAKAAAAQQSAVTFSVFAAETQQALPGVQVSVDNRVRGVTDARGELRVAGLGAGTHRASVTLIGRIPRAVLLQLAPGEERDALVLMEPIAVSLPGITAAARERSRDPRVEEFYRRAQNSTVGRFITRAQIEERNALVFSDIFRGMPGVRVSPGPEGNTVRNARAVAMSNGGDCAPIYFVDGFPYRPDGPVDTEFFPADIEGVELYMGNVPAQWGGSRAMCGVIVIWTRTTAAPATRN
ncbi:TonB-dependent receptor plug domain-containing protein [Longimicrobium sp.]|uniref:TonB-dependent receptor plug domain-containing protein n=1 Tax=Longimicrobium sp. TaxID=2029185 RepID=UPI002CD37E39|nr:TonB-dependent receptor plug domain-containing protein [Longimicrobium sp.]HSU15109.1 TonB-dependent receptor plug domain-containing protein [Longimicrobium sp.]